MKKIQLSLDPFSAGDENAIRLEIRKENGLSEKDTVHFRVLKRSIDARGRKIRVNLSVLWADRPIETERREFNYQNVSDSKKSCHIIGAGPAGLFAALRCLELGIKPVVIERGKDVRARRRDLAALNRQHLVNPESNYCFGEGGAGTYSDGKLYTRSGKRGDIEKILHCLVHHGASEEILIDAHPHIGTNKLPGLIQNIRCTVLDHGGEILFETRMSDLLIRNGRISHIQLVNNGRTDQVQVQKLILATGHSARDIYTLLHKKNILIEPKPFALGVRAEHSQELIDSIQYHCRTSDEWSSLRAHLPAASYSLVEQVNGRGVYSFCMCPGGIIAPCATDTEEVVTNGWSPSKRNNPFANSGIVVSVNEKDFLPFMKHGPLAGMEFQKRFERRAWEAGGKTLTAPAQRLGDFVNGKTSGVLPACSYLPGVKSSDVHEILDGGIGEALKKGFAAFGKKMRGYVSNEALVVAVESRTSTPVRIPRDKERLCHPQLDNLFPCGEGAGYAGGIMSAAMDGERCAEAASIITDTI